MDASKLTEMRMQAANTYKSNWKPLDASEVTNRNIQKAQESNQSTHQGPILPPCCTIPVIVTPNSGFSTDYSASIVFEKKAGCADCQDPNFGTAGGVQLLTCSEVATILATPPNPIKGATCYCADPGVNRVPVDCSVVTPGYTGWRNQVPTGEPRGNLIYSPLYPSH